MDALAPRSYFVGVKDWKVLALVPLVPEGLPWWQWVLIGLAALTLYVIVVSVIWYMFLEYFDKRTPYDRWLDQKEDDAEQAEWIDEMERKRKEKRKKK